MEIYYVTEESGDPDYEVFLDEILPFFSTRSAAEAAANRRNLERAAELAVKEREGLERWERDKRAVDFLVAGRIELPRGLMNLAMSYVPWYKPPNYVVKAVKVEEVD